MTAGTPPPAKGRGATFNPGNRFRRESREAFDDGWAPPAPDGGGVIEGDNEAPAPLRTTVTVQVSRTIISRNDSPDIPFTQSINPYQGCEHGCVYCYARPTHAYLDLSPGLDFETKLFAKPDAAELLKRELAKPGYVCDPIALGTNTDPYQPIEREWKVTRSILEVLRACEHPFSIVTKSSLVERDLDLIAPMAAERLAAAYVSITTLDPALARVMEPRAAAPSRRLRTIEALAKAGVPVGASVSPVIPFLNEPELERVLQAAADAGASAAFSIVLRLPWEVNPLFQQWLEQHFPERAARIMARVRDLRGGRDNDARFGTRMTGQGVWADLLRQRFDTAARRLGLNRKRIELDLSRFERPGVKVAQGCLF
jgi:DNA repair photolyase